MTYTQAAATTAVELRSAHGGIICMAYGRYSRLRVDRDDLWLLSDKYSNPVMEFHNLNVSLRFNLESAGTTKRRQCFLNQKIKDISSNAANQARPAGFIVSTKFNDSGEIPKKDLPSEVSTQWKFREDIKAYFLEKCSKFFKSLNISLGKGIVEHQRGGSDENQLNPDTHDHACFTSMELDKIRLAYDDPQACLDILAESREYAILLCRYFTQRRSETPSKLWEAIKCDIWMSLDSSNITFIMRVLLKGYKEFISDVHTFVIDNLEILLARVHTGKLAQVICALSDDFRAELSEVFRKNHRKLLLFIDGAVLLSLLIDLISDTKQFKYLKKIIKKDPSEVRRVNFNQALISYATKCNQTELTEIAHLLKHEFGYLINDIQGNYLAQVFLKRNNKIGRYMVQEALIALGSGVFTYKYPKYVLLCLLTRGPCPNFVNRILTKATKSPTALKQIMMNEFIWSLYALCISQLMIRSQVEYFLRKCSETLNQISKKNGASTLGYILHSVKELQALDNYPDYETLPEIL